MQSRDAAAIAAARAMVASTMAAVAKPSSSSRSSDPRCGESGVGLEDGTLAPSVELVADVAGVHLQCAVRQADDEGRVAVCLVR
jgi:hypothetical protein